MTRLDEWSRGTSGFAQVNGDYLRKTLDQGTGLEEKVSKLGGENRNQWGWLGCLSRQLFLVSAAPVSWVDLRIELVGICLGDRGMTRPKSSGRDSIKACRGGLAFTKSCGALPVDRLCSTVEAVGPSGV